MFVSKDKSLGFVHIPKTGGRFIETRVMRKKKVYCVGEKHGGVSDLPVTHKDAYIFSFIRNPYERIASLYRYISMFEYHRKLYPTIMDFLRKSKNTDERDLRLNQTDFIDGSVELYRFEEMGDSIKKLCNKIGVDEPRKDLNEDLNYFGPYYPSDFLSKESVDFITEECADDFNLLGYEKMSFDKIKQMGIRPTV